MSVLHGNLTNSILAELCVELLQEIGSQLSPADQKALCAVCRSLRLAILPLFYASVTLVLDVNNAMQLKTLSAGPTAWSHCRHLEIPTLAPAVGRMGLEEYEIMQKCLRPALESLTSLRTVRFTMQNDDYNWAQVVVIEVLNTRKQLHEFAVQNMMSADRFEDLPPVSRVRSLRVDTRQGYVWNPGFEVWLCRIIHHSPQLESLRFPPHLGSGTLCEMLMEENIQLKEVHGCHPDDALLRYLSTYSGLERLEIYNLYPAQAKRLFESIIPRHTTSLIVLKYADGVCSFSWDNIALISQLPHLETLEICVGSYEMRRQGGNAQRDIVEKLLDMAVELPALRDIAILSAICNCGIGCGMAMDRHREVVQREIGRTMKAFGQANRSPYVARLIGTHFQRVEKIGAWGIF
ncbi:hypothetical protein B0H19DRAFT_1274752 [Mycena capillaripes]|nr:hypothetical protein B0H19DRAFT_1274752 [Mycena capillaripes]